MDNTQFYRWRDFAARLARTFPGATDARRQKIESEVVDFIDLVPHNYNVADVFCWDGGPAFICDSIEIFLLDRRFIPYDITYDKHGDEKRRRFANQITACVRSGLDVAGEPSAGVVGFTVGDLRRMYGGQIPDWVNDVLEPPLTDAVPDDAGVWL